jgi:ABC-type transport system involved in multi-copper enzyme maturation permease subunit
MRLLGVAAGARLILILSVAAMTLREAARRRLLVTLALVCGAGVIFCWWGFSRLGTFTRAGAPISETEQLLLASQLLRLVSFAGTFVLACGAVFAAAPTIATEVESGVATAVVARPIRRWEMVLGKWLGLAAVVVGFTAVAGFLELVAVRAGSGYWPPAPVAALAYLSAQALVILSLALVLSTRIAAMASGVIGVAAFGLAWIGGILGGVGSAVDNPAIADIGRVTSVIIPTDGLWRGALYSLEPGVEVIAAGAAPVVSASPFFASAPPAPVYLCWAAAWILGMIALAAWSFSRREL